MNLWRLYNKEVDRRYGYQKITYKLAEVPSWIRKKKAFQDIDGVINIED